MAHPFAQLLYRALRASTHERNRVGEKLEELLAKNYDPREVCAAARNLHNTLLDEEERGVVADALDACYGIEES